MFSWNRKMLVVTWCLLCSQTLQPLSAISLSKPPKAPSRSPSVRSTPSCLSRPASNGSLLWQNQPSAPFTCKLIGSRPPFRALTSSWGFLPSPELRQEPKTMKVMLLIQETLIQTFRKFVLTEPCVSSFPQWSWASPVKPRLPGPDSGNPLLWTVASGPTPPHLCTRQVLLWSGGTRPEETDDLSWLTTGRRTVWLMHTRRGPLWTLRVCTREETPPWSWRRLKSVTLGRTSAPCTCRTWWLRWPWTWRL